MKRTLIVLGLLFWTFGSLRAQQRPLTLNEAIALSLQNNYAIQLSRNDSLVAALDYAYANYAFYPRLSGNGTYVFNNNNQNVTLSDGSKRERKGVKSNNLAASVNLNWTLFDGFRMFITRQRLGELVELGELQIKNQVITTVSEVMLTYYDIIRQQQQLRAVEELMQLSEERLRLAQYKLDVGTGARPDVLQAQIDLNAQRSAALSQQAAINRLKEQLNLLLVVPVGQEFTPADTTITFNPNLTLDSIQNGITATNPELLIARQNVNLAQLNLRERRAERFPVVAFNSAYNFNRNANQTVVNPVQPLFSLNKGFNYGLTATVPIFNGYNTRRLIRAAEIDIRFRELNYQQSLSQISTSVINAYRNYDLFKRTLLLEEDNMKLVREDLFIARERYRLGVSTFLEMREAQRSLEEANNRLIQARFQTKAAEIELLRLRGDLVR